MYNELKKTDPEVLSAIRNELSRIQDGIELIPSENFASSSIIECLASVFNNKYSEGYSGKRYYGGNEFVDVIEDLAIERAKRLFNAEHVNVQPLSGSPANQSVFFALLNIGDKFMGLDLGCGGHLTHGSPVNFSGRDYKCIPYAVDKETELLDMDAIRKIALREKPKMILSGLTAYPRKLDFKAFQEIAEEVNAYHMSDIAHISGLVCTGFHENPVPIADVVTTTTHKTLRGPRGAIVMCKREDRLHNLYHNNTNKNLAQLIDSAVFPGLQGGPHDHVTAAKAVCFKEALKPEFKEYARQIIRNAKVLADELIALGLKLVTNGTDNHLMVIDLTKKALTGKGKEIQNALESAGIYTNKNAIPYDPATPFNPSGIRIGTPAITTRGFKEQEMKEIAKAIVSVIDNYQDNRKIVKVREDILEICKQFPLYEDMRI